MNAPHASQALIEALAPLWYREIAEDIDIEYFRGFLARNAGMLHNIFELWLSGALGGGGAEPVDADDDDDNAATTDPSLEDADAAVEPELAPGDPVPAAAPTPVMAAPRTPIVVAAEVVDPVEAWTKSQRTKANLAAMQLVHDKRPEDMTAAERGTLLGYSGWGGLSIADSRDRFPPGMTPEDFGLIHEYYTPKRVADAMAESICPLLPTLGVGGKVLALEPSAGIGRLIRSLSALPCGVDVEWIAVEFSRISARMLGALRPDITLHRGTFESWAHAHGPKVQGSLSLVLANRETQSYAYFIRRSMDLLAPGGLGVFLIPAGLLTGSRNRELRRRILLRNHLAAAFRLPSMEGRRTLFPGANLVVDCVYLRSRGGQLAEVDASDEAILEGRYFEDFPVHVLGTESGKDRGEDDQTRGGSGRYRYTVEGRFTGLPKLVERPMCEACIVRPQGPAAASRTPSRGPVRSTDVDLAGTEPWVASAILLGLRIDTFLAAYAARNAELATTLWPELHDALEQLRTSPALASAGGNPWQSEALRAQAGAGVVGAERLLAAFDRSTGALIEPLRVRPIFERRYEGRADDIVAQAEWLFASRRRITLADLTAFHISVGGGLPQSVIRRTLLDARWCLDGEGWDELVPAASYYTGDLWPKYDRARAHESADPQAAEQVRQLLATIAPAVFEDLEDVSPRSAWVPLELREAWIGSAINRGLGNVALRSIGGVIMPAGIDQYEDLARAPALSQEAMWVLGWINHDRSMFAPLSERKDGESVDDARVRLGHAWDASFREWVRRDPARREAVADAYNRRFRGFVPRTYSPEPLSIARWAPDGPRLHPWQIAGARRILDNRGGILALGVGLGKTFTAAATLAMARQEGWVRRPVILVPTSLVWKWVDDLRRVLPDYRVGVVGSRRKVLQRGPRVERAAALLAQGSITAADHRRMLTTSEPDSPAERAATWTRLQAGELDVVVLTYDALPRTRVNLDALIEYVDRKAAVQRMLTLRRRNEKRREEAKRRRGGEPQDGASETDEAPTVAGMTERKEAVLKHSTAGWVAERLALPEGWEYDPGIAWDDIGIDWLIVDEGASYKNLHLPEPREYGVPRFMGNPGEGSDRAWQLDFRAALVRQRTGGSGIVLLSATPAKNSPLEFYNLIQYVDDQAFARVGIEDPEQFIDRYLKIQARQVLDASLSATTESAVVGFRNLDELRGIIFRYCEFRTAEEVGLRLPEPKVQIVEVEMDARQEGKYDPLVADIQESIKASDMSDVLGKLARLALIAVHADMDEGYSWSTALAGGPETRKIPQTSLATWQARGWELVQLETKEQDGRPKVWATITRTLPRPAYDSPKFRAIASRVAASRTCGHIIFCDNVAAHRWLVEVLVAHGIPRERIAVLNAKATKSAQDRLSVARGFNGDPDTPPLYDVVIANAIAYEGIDLQTRTCAIHHVDLPWTPSDLEQRNGRAYRQGNQLSTIAIYYYFAQRSMDGMRYAAVQGKVTWLVDLIQSSKRETNNPGAQQDLSPEETLLMISRDKEGTQRLLAEVKAKKEQERREVEAKNAARVLARANARFRDARAEGDSVEAARLRGEGEALLADLQRVPAESWPWAPWIGRVREVEYLIPRSGACPVFEGLRVGMAGAIYKDRIDYFEFGRLLADDSGALIGLRGAGAEEWSLRSAEDVEELTITPDALQRGASAWPDLEAERTEQAILTHLARLAASGLCTWARLGWQGASDTFVEAWWPKIRQAFVQGVLRAYHNEEVYPLVIGGVLHLATRERLGEGELLSPTPAGFRQYLALAPLTRLTYTELAEVAQAWWFRAFPRGLLTEARAAAEAVAKGRPAEASAQGEAPAPALAPKSASREPTPVAVAEPASGLTPPRQAEPAPTTSTRVGHFYRVGDQVYGDTALIGAFQAAGFPAEHAGFGDFDVRLPGGKVAFHRHADEALFADQVGRLHLLVPDRGVALSIVLDDLVARGHARSSGAWKDWPGKQSAPEFTLESTRDEVLAALQAADPAAHAHAERGAWDRLEHHEGPARELAQRAHAWASYHRHLPAQVRAAVRVQVEADLRGLGLPDELQTAYLEQLAVADAEGRDVQAVLAEARSRKAAEDERRAQPTLAPELGAVAARAGLVHFSVEKQELLAALKVVRSVMARDDQDLGKLEVACHGHVILRVGTPGGGERPSFFELRLLTTKCHRAGEVTVGGVALHDALRAFSAGPIEVLKSEGRSTLMLRQRALATNLPTFDYVPIAPVADAAQPAGVIELEGLGELIGRVAYAVSRDDAREGLTMVRLRAGQGQLFAYATDGHRLARAVRPLAGGEPLDEFLVHRDDAERLRRLATAYVRLLHPKGARAPVLTLSVRPGALWVGTSDALRFVVSKNGARFPGVDALVPTRAREVLVIAGDELVQHCKAAEAMTKNHAQLRLRVCPGRADVSAEGSDTGATLAATITDLTLYGRPFTSLVRATYLREAIENLPTTKYVALAYNADDPTDQLCAVPWSADGPSMPNARALDLVGRELKAGALAIVMPMRSNEEAPHGCTD